MAQRHLVTPRAAVLVLAAHLLSALLLALSAAGPAEAQRAEADVFVARAILAYEDKRYEDASGALAEALRLDPDNVDALYYTGLVAMAQNRPDAAAQALARARALAPGDDAVRFQLGVVYFSQTRYDEALPLLEPLLASRPTLDGLGYYVGFMRYRQKDYQGALRAFRAGTSDNSDIQQLTRFYSGLALAGLGLPEQAAAEIEEVRRLQPTSPLTGPAERIRDSVVAARAAEQRFHAEVRLGFLYDDNVSVSPTGSPDPLVRLLRQQGQASTGELAAVRFDYAFLRTGPWELTATASLFTTYYNELTEFNVVDYLGALTGTYRGAIAAMPFQLGLQYTYDYLTLGGDEFVQRHTVAPFFTLVENAGNVSSLQLRFQDKQYAADSGIPREERRDGQNWMVGLLHLFRFQSDQHFIKVGYQFDYDDTEGPHREGRNYSYLGHRLIAGGQYTLPWLGIRLKYDFDVHLRDYANVNTLFPITAPGTVKRRDREYTSIVGVVIPLPHRLNLLVEWQRIWDDSNVDVFRYTRNVVSGTLVWTY